MIDRITADPKIHFGKPCVTGTHVTVQSVLELVEQGIPFDSIVQDNYPELSVEDARACLRYAVSLVITEEIHLAREDPIFLLGRNPVKCHPRRRRFDC